MNTLLKVIAGIASVFLLTLLMLQPNKKVVVNCDSGFTVGAADTADIRGGEIRWGINGVVKVRKMTEGEVCYKSFSE
jgi:hypothetical protein